MIRTAVQTMFLFRNPLGRWLRDLHARLSLWHRRAHDRRRLGSMTERELRDIGIHPGDVYEEVRKPFWRR